MCLSCLWTTGTVGNTWEARCHFKEFARLELGGNWYRISDPFLWKIHLKFKKVNEAVDQVDYNNDDDMIDILWKDNGTYKLPNSNTDF